jgi:hypothetical protein
MLSTTNGTSDGKPRTSVKAVYAEFATRKGKQTAAGTDPESKSETVSLSGPGSSHNAQQSRFAASNVCKNCHHDHNGTG